MKCMFSADEPARMSINVVCHLLYDHTRLQRRNEKQGGSEIGEVKEERKCQKLLCTLEVDFCSTNLHSLI